MGSTYGAYIPIEPFNAPIPIPSVPPDNPGDAVQITLSRQWIAPLLGACVSLLALSTWNTDNSDDLNVARQWANRLLKQIMSYTVPMAIQFRVNPDDTAHWQYSNDAGVTWVNGPNTTVQDNVIITDPTGVQVIDQPANDPLTVISSVGGFALDIVGGIISPPASAQEAIIRADKKLSDAINILELMLVTP